jgi:hypothetical protein
MSDCQIHLRAILLSQILEVGEAAGNHPVGQLSSLLPRGLVSTLYRSGKHIPDRCLPYRDAPAFSSYFYSAPQAPNCKQGLLRHAISQVLCELPVQDYLAAQRERGVKLF